MKDNSSSFSEHAYSESIVTTATAADSGAAPVRECSSTAQCPYFQSPDSLQSYAVDSEGTLLQALSHRDEYGASLFVFRFSRINNEISPTSNALSFASLCPDSELSSGSNEMLWELLCHTSSWGLSACGQVSENTWSSLESAKRIRDQLRLASFIGLRAVIVPLPDMDKADEGGMQAVAFKRAVRILSEHLQTSQTASVWVRCDALCCKQRAAFSLLRSSIIWRQGTPPSVEAAAHSVSRTALHRVKVFLTFPLTFGAIPSEWLGESIAAFEVPAVEKLKRALCGGMVDTHRIQLPSDVLPLVDSYWATAQPMFLSLGAFLVELLRRRTMPVFTMREFHMAKMIIGLVHENYVMNEQRDKFVGYEDVLQLPLQPLGHTLPSGVYEVFEEDVAKYRLYYTAMCCYFKEWVQHRNVRSHERLCSIQASEAGSASGDKCAGTLYAVVLGAGRGPLVSECLCAATGAGVRVNLFVVEKNPEAVKFLHLRRSIDPQWREWINTCGHVLEVIHADARTLLPSNTSGSPDALPPNWGLCDLVVSELLGSLGDNELSPECLDDFYKSLLCSQKALGIPPNPYLTSIPQQYTAWVAPLHSSRFEEAVAEAAIGGLTVPPPGCADPHAALFHSTFVSNVCRAVSLCAPQECWTFHHFTEEGQPWDRDVTLKFPIPGKGRCSGFIGFFTAVLYSGSAQEIQIPVHTPQVSLSTMPQERTLDLFSWFPFLLPLAPRDIAEVVPGDEVQLHLQRCVDLKGARVWYSYEATVLRQDGAASAGDRQVSIKINDGGWASSVSLCAKTDNLEDLGEDVLS
ncbi:PRMT5 arginine N methyltransferase SAM binding domain [Trypanosoma vivax]|nr:PRMT5 arginine N methyltransferase SAM binding domain [Trypanosoma vivax]